MRTFKEFIKQMQEAHSCEKCDGKIFAIEMDGLGITYCAYCNEKVMYPHSTPKELNAWMKLEDGNVS